MPATLKVCCLPVHEVLEAEVEGAPDLKDQLLERWGEGTERWPPQFMEHPAVMAAGPGATVWPLGFVCDKVPIPDPRQRVSLLHVQLGVCQAPPGYSTPDF